MRLISLAVTLGLGCATGPEVGSLESSAASSPAPLIVQTTGGLVQGVIEGDVRAFRGLPYAAPPVGELRWRAPRPPAPWSGVREASSFAPFCDVRVAPGDEVPFSEDCLYVNLYTPASLPNTPLPVIVVMHGAGDSALSANGIHPTPPPRLATRGAVVVMVDWRSQTILSTFDHPALAAEHDGAGNFGVLDLIAALEWVRDNAEAFGGDPARVMLHANNYGIALQATPLARGLFSAAAVEAGGRIVTRLPATAEAIGEEFADASGCSGAPDPLACLRALTPEELMAVPVPPRRWGVVQDGRVFTAPIYDAIAASGTVPLLVGSGRDEASASGVFSNYDQDPFTEEDYVNALHEQYDSIGDVVDSIVALYPAADYPSPVAALLAVDTDALVTCNMRRVALAAADGGERRVWRWLMTHRFENDPVLALLGAYHKQMAHFVLGDFANIFGIAYTPSAAEEELTRRIQDTWIHFAATGDPNGGPLGHQWPRYRAGDERMLVIDTATSTIEGFHVPQCEFWDQNPW